MASRRSHAATHSKSSISAVSRGDTYLSETHCKLRRSAAVGQTSPHPLLVPQSGTDYQPQHHRGCVSPPSGNYMWWRFRTYPQLRCFAACSGFHDIGPAPRNPQLKLNLLVVRGCVTMARRHSLLRSHSPQSTKIMASCQTNKSSKVSEAVKMSEYSFLTSSVQPI